MTWFGLVAFILLTIERAASAEHSNVLREVIKEEQYCGADGFLLDAAIPQSLWRRRSGEHVDEQVMPAEWQAIMEEMKTKRTARKRRAATSQADRVWPGAKIPYTISSSFSSSHQRLIRDAMDHWEEGTCIEFVNRTTEVDYVYIYKGNGCCSHVGRRKGKQFLSLGYGCLRFGIITHELGHAVGFWHEQNRPDRSIYVDVMYDNVDTSKFLNFDLRELNEVETFDQVYDYKSIMHYGAKFFSRNGYNTIRSKGYASNVETNNIGNAYFKYSGPVLSAQDIIETNLLYKCNEITDCGGTLFASSGTFTSPNHPEAYTQQARECVWIVTTTKPQEYGGYHSSLTLQFEDFKVGRRANKTTGHCDDDYIEIREGKGFLSPYVTRYCGKTMPAPVVTLTGSLYIKFFISGKNQAIAKRMKGFTGSFKTDVCSQKINKMPGHIQTPSFPFAYRENTDCLYVLDAGKGMQVRLEFPFFRLREIDQSEGCEDFVEIHEGSKEDEKFVGRYCGAQNPGKLLINSRHAKVHFHASSSKHSGWYMGFKAVYEAVDIDECKRGEHGCSQVCLNYPGGYICGCHVGYMIVHPDGEGDTKCVDKDECAKNNGGCSHDCINTDGSYICSCPSGYTFSTNSTTCVDIDECAFQTKPCDHECRNFAGGYECSCRAGYLLGRDNATCTALRGCENWLTSPVGVIHSPEIPVTYQHRVTCRWTIRTDDRYQLSVNMELPWGDNLGCTNSVILGQSEEDLSPGPATRLICMQSDIGEDIRMPGNLAVIEYHGQPPFLPPITIQYHSILPIDLNCGQDFNTSTGAFTSLGFPYRYPEEKECTWRIFSPKNITMEVQFEEFDIEPHKECAFDFVDVEEHYKSASTIKKIGRFCGSDMPPITLVDGQRSYLVIRFSADATISGAGFKVSFRELQS